MHEFTRFLRKGTTGLLSVLFLASICLVVASQGAVATEAAALNGRSIGNVLLNPGFEDWAAGPEGPPDSWLLSVSANLTATQETTLVDSGVSSCNLTWTTTETVWLSQIAVVTPGTQYDLRVRYYDNDLTGRIRLWVRWEDEIGTLISTNDGGYSTDLGEWQLLELVAIMAPANATRCNFQIRVYDVSPWDGEATVYIDSAEIMEGITPPTPTMGPPTETPIPTTPTPMGSVVPTPTPNPALVINEVYYDDVSTDDESFIELYGPAGMVLDNYSVSPINQDCEVLCTVQLTGYVMPEDGFFVIGMTGVANTDIVSTCPYQLQGGPCDGVILSYYATIHDAVYYSSVTCLNQCGEGDPAPDPTDLSHTISRYPDGVDTNNNAVDFCESLNTVGMPNECAPLPTTPPPTDTPTVGPTYTPTPFITVPPTETPPTETPVPVIVINEVFYDDPSTDDEGFIELYGEPGMMLTGFSVKGLDQTCGTICTISLDGYTVPADGFFVIAQNELVANYDLIAASCIGLLQNGPCDGVGLYLNNVLIDAVQYGLACTPACGEGNPAVEPTDLTNTISRFPDGYDTNDNALDFCISYNTAGFPNDCTEPSATPTPTEPVPPTDTPTVGPTFTPTPYLSPTVTPIPPTETPVPLIVINEIYYDDPATDDAGFIELYGEPGMTLTGFSVKALNQDCEVICTINLDGQVVPGDGFFVIAQNEAVSNWDLVASSCIGSLQNGPCDGVGLYVNDTLIDVVQYGVDCVNACGEGTPVPEPLDINSLSRYPDGADTNDNATDFCESFVTSGLPNQCYSIVTPTPTPLPCINDGDINNDFLHSAGDAQLCFSIAIGVMIPNDEERCSADCNGDNVISAGDAQLIFYAAVGIGGCVDPIIADFDLAARPESLAALRNSSVKVNPGTLWTTTSYSPKTASYTLVIGLDTANEVDAFTLSVTFDPTALVFVDSKAGELNPQWTMFDAAEAKPGLVKAAAFTTTSAISKAARGSLVILEFALTTELAVTQNPGFTVSQLLDDLSGYTITRK